MSIVARFKTETELEWLIEDTLQSGDWETLAAAAKQQPVILIAPAIDVLLLPIALPPLRPQRLLKAIPFAVEDQLSEEITDYHFVLSKPFDAAINTVAVISKATLAAWIDAATVAAVF